MKGNSLSSGCCCLLQRLKALDSFFFFFSTAVLSCLDRRCCPLEPRVCVCVYSFVRMSMFRWICLIFYNMCRAWTCGWVFGERHFLLLAFQNSLVSCRYKLCALFIQRLLCASHRIVIPGFTHLVSGCNNLVLWVPLWSLFALRLVLDP